MARKRSHRPKSPGKDTRATVRFAREPVLPAASRLSKRKKLLFAAIATLATFCFVELLLWVVGVAPSYYQIDPYAGFATHIPHFIPTTDDKGREWLTVAPSKSGYSISNVFWPKNRPGPIALSVLAAQPPMDGLFLIGHRGPGGSEPCCRSRTASVIGR
jgi:hypothetical protein